MNRHMPLLAAIMVFCLFGGAWQAWRGNMGRSLLLLVVGIVIAGYVVLQAFVPGARQ